MKSKIPGLLIVCVAIVFVSATIDLSNLLNYSGQTIPNYITQDNTGHNPITDEGATLGRVLFYDKNLSSNHTVACATCHQQEFAFGDTAQISQGVNGQTGRHSMRLINSKFGEEVKFFWDERADSLEMQTTMPIKDHVEMGFSGQNGDPDFNDLIARLDTIDYYADLFFLAFGDTVITEDKIQKALSQFVRSIQSYDSEFDFGRVLVNNDLTPFPNYSQSENAGKMLFIAPPQFNGNGERTGGGLGCAGCHRPPEFDIDPNSLSNGVLFAAGQTPPNGTLDTFITRSPTLRDIFNPFNQINGPLMHNGNFATLNGVLQHYNGIPDFGANPTVIPFIDNRLMPNGQGQDLNMTPQEVTALNDFIRTLTGSDVYLNEKWSDPFDANGNLTITGSLLSYQPIEEPVEFFVFPNPVNATLNIQTEAEVEWAYIFNNAGQLVKQQRLSGKTIQVEMNDLSIGMYLLNITDADGNRLLSKKIIKQ